MKNIRLVVACLEFIGTSDKDKTEAEKRERQEPTTTSEPGGLESAPMPPQKLPPEEWVTGEAFLSRKDRRARARQRRRRIL